MLETHRRKIDPRIVKVLAAVVIGLSVGTMVPPKAVLLPAVGAVPGLLVGGLGLVAGAALFQWGPRLVGVADCGCTGDCGCSA